MSQLSQTVKLQQKKDSVLRTKYLLILRTGNFKTAKHLLRITVTTVCYRHTVALDKKKNALLYRYRNSFMFGDRGKVSLVVRFYP